MKNDESRVALVTGAGGGIGRATSRLLATNGITVVVTDIDYAKAEETVGLIKASGGTATAFALDVSDPGAVDSVYREVAQRFERLDVQISHAGVTTRAAFISMPLDKFDEIVRTNLYGTFLCGQAAARLMLQTGGHIVNTTSVSGQQGGTGRAAYGASKAAIINLTQTMAVELAPFGILVNAVAPGPTQVERTAHGPGQKAAMLARLAIKRYAEPDEVAAAIAFLVSPQNTYVTGHVLNVDGGFAAAGVMYDPDKEAS